MYFSLYCKGSKRLFKVFVWEGAGDRTELQYFDPHSYGRQRWVFLVLQGCSTGGPGTQLSAGWWLSLLHLISNFSGLQLIRGSRSPFGLMWLSLPHLVYNSVSNWFLISVLTELYNRLLDLWNGMFDRHQVEITVMQFTGHSLPVYQSMSVPWEFLACPILLANFRPRDLFRLLAIGMCHFLPVHHFVMACLLGPKVKIQQLVLDSNNWTHLTW